MFTDEIILYFENPAADAMGHNHVSGKVRALDDKVVLHWKVRDRTFKKSGSEPHTLELAYDALETAVPRARFFLKTDLVLRLRDPRPIAEIPGADMGELVLHLGRRSRREATKFAKLVDYKLAEIDANSFIGRGSARADEADRG